MPLLLVLGCAPAEVEIPLVPPPGYDPVALALAEAGEAVKTSGNREAAIPPMCYTKTGGTSNPCWVCHTGGNPPQPWDDRHLQQAYAFSDVGLTNHWENLFEDRSDRVAAISDEEILAYVRVDNYAPLRAAMTEAPREFAGWRPDLDLAAGFDEEGFARDGTGWRAVRYKPFLGSFWPTNGNTDDAFVRLPRRFRETRELYRLNLALLEAAVTLDPNRRRGDPFVREVEPVSEELAGFDLDGDGQIEPEVTEIRALPERYAGAAADTPLGPYEYPEGTEYLHSVRYVDPDAPNLMSARMKELRYSRRETRPERDTRQRLIEHEVEDRARGLLPTYQGSALSGLRSGLYLWRYQGWIEDQDGWLRLQTHEEHRFCMGCHGAIGVNLDGTFTLPRKLPGAAGWRPQDLRGIPDAPQHGHAEPEYLTYFERNRGGDELRANDEILARFFDTSGTLAEVRRTEVLRAAPGGDQDLAWLLAPSRERALLVDKAYRVIVQDQDFVHGRDATVRPPANVHREIVNGGTENGATGLYFEDGVLALDWTGVDLAR